MRRRPERRRCFFLESFPTSGLLAHNRFGVLEGVGSRSSPTFRLAEGDDTMSEPPTNPRELRGEDSKTVWALLASKAWTISHRKTRDGTSSSVRLWARMVRLKVRGDQTRTEKPVTETHAEHSRTVRSPHVLPSMAHRASRPRVLTRPVCFGARSRRRLRDDRGRPTMPHVFGYENAYPKD